MLQSSTLLLRESCRLSVKNATYYLEYKKNLSVLMKISKFWGFTKKFFNYSEPYFRVSKIQHPTSRVVETFKYAPELKCSKAIFMMICSGTNSFIYSCWLVTSELQSLVKLLTPSD